MTDCPLRAQENPKSSDDGATYATESGTLRVEPGEF